VDHCALVAQVEQGGGEPLVLVSAVKFFREAQTAPEVLSVKAARTQLLVCRVLAFLGPGRRSIHVLGSSHRLRLLSIDQLPAIPARRAGIARSMRRYSRPHPAVFALAASTGRTTHSPIREK